MTQVKLNPKSSIGLKILPEGLMKSLLFNDLSGLFLTIENHHLSAIKIKTC